MKKIFISGLSFIMCVAFLLSGCGTKKTGYTNEIVINLPGIDREYRYFLLNDTHIFIEDDEIRDEYKGLVTERVNQFSLDGQTSAENLKKWIEGLDQENLDGVILNADIEDQLSKANISYVRDVLKTVQIPCMYLMSDHDYATTWTCLNEENYKAAYDIINAEGYDRPFTCFEEEGFIILGMNKTWEDISEDTLNEVKDVLAKGKPVIIISHVPYDSFVSEEMTEISKEAKNGRVLLWGLGGECEYQPNGYTEEYLKLISSSDSNVVAVIGAHLHTTASAAFTEKATEYLAGTGYGGTRTLVRICPLTE